MCMGSLLLESFIVRNTHSTHKMSDNGSWSILSLSLNNSLLTARVELA